MKNVRDEKKIKEKYGCVWLRRENEIQPYNTIQNTSFNTSREFMDNKKRLADQTDNTR